MGVKLWEVAASIREARDWLSRASEQAVEASGYIPPTPFGDEPDPGEPGWQAMLDLSDALGKIELQLAAIIPPEVAEAIEQESREDDDMADRAEALRG